MIYRVNQHVSISSFPDSIQEIDEFLKDGKNIFITLTEKHELQPGIPKGKSNHLHFPIVDYQIPDSKNVLDLFSTLKEKNPAHIIFQCMGGSGRSPLMASAWMIYNHGYTHDMALAEISKARMKPVPETDSQTQWIERFHDHLSGK